MHSHGDILTKPFEWKISEHGQTDGKFKFSKLCCTKAHGGIRTIAGKIDHLFICIVYLAVEDYLSLALGTMARIL